MYKIDAKSVAFFFKLKSTTAPSIFIAKNTSLAPTSRPQVQKSSPLPVSQLRRRHSVCSRCHHALLLPCRYRSPLSLLLLAPPIVPLLSRRCCSFSLLPPSLLLLWSFSALSQLSSQELGNVYYAPSPIPQPVLELDADFKGLTRQKNSSYFHRLSFQKSSLTSWRMPSDYSRTNDYSRLSDYLRWGSSDDDNGLGDSPNITFLPAASIEDGYGMVGRSELKDHVGNMKVSCVGRGLMDYLGNKGSISISMSLHETSFCFICSHLTSGQKEGDELRRNSDVMEFLKKARFPRVHGSDNDKSLETILHHDRIIWLGDLNYRIALSYRLAKALVEMRNWRALLENNQLRIEQKSILWQVRIGLFMAYFGLKLSKVMEE